MLKSIYSSFMRVHILHHASKTPIYGVCIMEELKRHGYNAGPGTVYPILHQLEREEYLTSESKTVNGRVRIYYHISLNGTIALQESLGKLRELAAEVLE